MKKYRVDQVQTVYKQFNKDPHSVVMSLDNGHTWFSPPMDTGKWFSNISLDMHTTIVFAFLR